VDSRERRHYFQRAACRQLGIANAHPRLGRIEVLAPEPADLVIAQALGPIAKVIQLVRPWVAAGGWLVVPSGPTPPRVRPGAGWGLDGARPYRVPGGGAPRSFWFARKVAERPGGPGPVAGRGQVP
jgi:16S rRNA (guanine527-N7)-methyltransferase